MISIIVPVYNVSEYLPECMKSIAAQKYDNIEVILVDDGSTDGSGILCDQYEKEYKYVKVVHQKNAGLSSARNTGIRIARGDFITFVDSDDMIASDFLIEAMKLANLYNADLIAFAFERCETHTKWTSEYIQECDKKINIYDNPIVKMKDFLIESDIGTMAWAKVYRKELFDSVVYPVGKYHEDVFTTYKVVDKANCIVTTSQIGYRYRKNPNSITTSTFSEKRLDCVQGKKEQLGFIIAKYPMLQKEAETGVIYACNQCLMLMAKANYKNKDILKEFQIYYKKYGKSYLINSKSKKGKTIVHIAMCNINLVYNLFKFVL